MLFFFFFAISAGVISRDSEFDAITFALNYTAPFSNITINLRTFNTTEPANGVCKLGKILIRSNQELTLLWYALVPELIRRFVVLLFLIFFNGVNFWNSAWPSAVIERL